MNGTFFYWFRMTRFDVNIIWLKRRIAISIHLLVGFLCFVKITEDWIKFNVNKTKDDNKESLIMEISA